MTEPSSVKRGEADGAANKWRASIRYRGRYGQGRGEQSAASLTEKRGGIHFKPFATTENEAVSLAVSILLRHE